MSETKEPGWNARRSHRAGLWFAGILVVIVVALSAGWFFIAQRVDGVVRDAIASENSETRSLVCDNQQIVGFPFRMGLACDAVRFRDDTEGLDVTAAGLRSAAQIYAPNHLVLELQSPLRVLSANLLPLEFRWESLLISLRTRGGEPHRLTLEAQKLAIAVTREAQANQPVARVSRVFGVAETVPSGSQQLAGSYSGNDPLRDARLFLEFEDIVLANMSLPPINAAGQVYVEYGKSLLGSTNSFVRASSTSDGNIDIQGITLALGESRLVVTGALTVDQDGFLSGSLEATVSQLDQGISTIQSAFNPRQATQKTLFQQWVTALLPFAQPAPTNDDPSLRRLPPIRVTRGAVQLGFLPLGTLPPLLQ